MNRYRFRKVGVYFQIFQTEFLFRFSALSLHSDLIFLSHYCSVGGNARCNIEYTPKRCEKYLMNSNVNKYWNGMRTLTSKNMLFFKYPITVL